MRPHLGVLPPPRAPLFLRPVDPLQTLSDADHFDASPRCLLGRRAQSEIEAAGKSLLGGLMFTCTARNEEADAKAFTSTFPKAPVVGLPCGGEIGPRARGDTAGRATQVGDVPLHAMLRLHNADTQYGDTIR